MLDMTIRRLVCITAPKWLVLPLTNQLIMGGTRSSMETSWGSPTMHTTIEVSCTWNNRWTPNKRGIGKSHYCLTRPTHLDDRKQTVLSTPTGDWPMPVVKNCHLCYTVATGNPTSQSTDTDARCPLQRTKVAVSNGSFKDEAGAVA